MRTLTEDQIQIGSVLPELSIELTPTVVVSTALATMDFTPVHHDTEIARAQGSKDIFLNILTTMGLVERYVTDWAGPEAVIRHINVKLGVPAYAGDRLSFTGTIVSQEDGQITVEVRGKVSLGDHATGTITFILPEHVPPEAPSKESRRC
jgi:acyl dehydratase